MKLQKNKFRMIKLCFILSFIIIFSTLTPMPRIANIGLSTVIEAESVSIPSASLKEGRYFGTQKITLTSSTEGAVIFYTTDATKPGMNSIKYTQPITLNKSSYIRAIAVIGSSKSSELANYYEIYYDYKLIRDDVERYEKAIENNKVNSLSKEDQQVCNKIKKLISKYITSDMTAYKKVKWVHDYIINHTIYDTENYNAGYIPEASYTIKGVLIDGVAVCQGYAETFQLFMNLLNINNKMITGYGNGGSHAWNLVKLSGDWYHVDTTWDDPVTAGGEQTIQYQYFLVNDKQIKPDHSWITNDYPVCTSDTLTYKIYEGCIISSVSEYEKKFTELYKKGLKNITILYPENKIPNLDFYFNLTESNNCSYYEPVKFGKYYIFTIVMN
jgi:hypothetical protein